MVNRIDWDRFTRGATDTYSDIDSLDRIRQPSPQERGSRNCRFPEGFPAAYSPNWWALRKRYEELLAREQSRLRWGESWSPEARHLSDVAQQAGLGIEAADAQYVEIDPDTGLHHHLSPALRALRDRDPARFHAISTEALRLQALGRPTRAAIANAARPMPR